MKGLGTRRLILMLLLAAGVAVLGFGGVSSAFHSGGVAHCDGCHSMHNSADNPVSGVPNTQLLKGTDASSTCLNCHAGLGKYRIASNDPTQVNYTSGGDFSWVLKTYTVNLGYTTKVLPGDNAGHNVKAVDFGYENDGSHATGPGGSYPANVLGCTSCHDAHGKVNGGTAAGNPSIEKSGSYGAWSNTTTPGSIVGNFRLLGDASYVTPDGFSFTKGAPIAAAAHDCGVGGDGACYDEVFGGRHTEFGYGSSEWCANCHTGFPIDCAQCHPGYFGGSIDHRHPVSSDAVMMGGYSQRYDKYLKTGDFNGDTATAYLTFVPIERYEFDRTKLDPNTTGGAMHMAYTNGYPNITCLTCHRAHASAFQNIGRWDFSATFLVDSHPRPGDVGYDLVDPNAPYYGVDIEATFGKYQRSFCNKCHQQD